MSVYNRKRKANMRNIKVYSTVVLSVILLLFIQSCSKPDTNKIKSDTRDETTKTEQEKVALDYPLDTTKKTAKTNHTAVIQTGEFLSAVTTAADSFTTRMEAQDKIRSILSSDTILDETTISNMLAGLDTEEIARILVNTPYERENPTTESYNYMNMYEEVLRRGKPPWSRLIALSDLLDFYIFNVNKMEGNKEKRNQFEKLGLELKPSDASDNASKGSFVSIKLKLLTTLPYEQQLPLADEIEKYPQQGISLSKPTLEFVSIHRAITPINLKRPAEGRAIIQKMHDNIENMEGYNNIRNIKDVDKFMDRQMNRNIYPEFNKYHPDYEKRHSIYY